MLLIVFAAVAGRGQGEPAVLPGTDPLEVPGNLSEQMVAGISRYLDRELANAPAERDQLHAAAAAAAGSEQERIDAKRERLRRIIGAVDPRVPRPGMQLVSSWSTPAKVAETDRYVIHAVRWPVLEGVHGEGLLLQPKGAVVARVVAVPDADQTPEQITGLIPGRSPGLQYARRLAENGCQVIVPTLADRTTRYSGNPRVKRTVNQPHREWIYRQAYTLGRHVIGYEVQKILSAVDWMEGQEEDGNLAIGVAGWGEGGLLALHAAAIDTRIDAVLVSGYFGPRERVWEEPIYRNVFGLLNEFGDAEIARLVLPRAVLVEYSAVPEITAAPYSASGRPSATPGWLETPSHEAVRSEVERARRLAGGAGGTIRLYQGKGGDVTGPMAEDTVRSFLQSLNGGVASLAQPGRPPRELRARVDEDARQERVVREMERHTQRLLQLAMGVRDEFLWQEVPPTTPDAWREAMRPYREQFWDEVMGRLPPGELPLNPRSRLLDEAPGWTAYEVMLDVLPDVYAWGYFLVPKGIQPGEKRPVVVAQHGLNGTPADVVNQDRSTRAYRAYKAFAVELVERGFIVFAPQNPYWGDDQFRVLQRKANPLGKSLFSVIIAQHERILDWLSAQPAVDPARIGFYGLSYGGKTAMRVPAVLERYAVSVCSGDFNEWIWKNATIDWRNSYMFTGEYEMFDFNLGSTFGYAEMAALIAPRPFMVERGHNDGVGIDEWVAFEYARVNRLYNKLGIPERTEIEYFDGPHTIHGAGTYAFLHRHLQWPEPAVAREARISGRAGKPAGATK